MPVVCAQYDGYGESAAFDVDHLQTNVGCPVVPIVAIRKKGLEELRCTLGDISKTVRLPENECSMTHS